MRSPGVLVVANAIALALQLAACLPGGAVDCADGRFCPAGTVCDEARHDCVLPEQVAVCTDQPREAPCSYAGVADGRCFDEVCLPAGCGNGEIETGEVCDDSNQTSGDRCRDDCRSTETCGNGEVDRITGEDCDDGNLISHDGCSSTCGEELPTWDHATLGVPTPRPSAAAYDLARQKLVTFGNVITAPPDFWEFDGRGWSQRFPRLMPSQRQYTAMVYDAARHRTVVFGGAGSGIFGDTWDWDGVRWRLRTTPLSPANRYAHAMAYDGARREVVLFGGASIMTFFGAPTWIWDGNTWSPRAAGTQPAARIAPAMAADPVRGTVILFGGVSATVLFDDTWEWNGLVWQQLTTVGAPPGRWAHAMAYDPVRARIVMMGGYGAGDPPVPLADTWELDTATRTWMQRSPAAQPRAAYAMAYDHEHRRTLAYGGDGAGLPIWAWDGAGWTTVAPAPQPPGQRVFAAMAWDPLRGRAIMHGGSERISMTLPADTWELDGSWFPLAGGPPGRAFHPMAANPDGNGVFVFGGYPTYADAWRWAGGWIASLAGPPTRFRGGIATDTARGRVVLAGGRDAVGPVGDAWEWDGAAWDPIPALPRLADGASATFDPRRGRTVVFGGTDGVADSAAVDEWDGTAWQTPALVASPAPRQIAAMAYDARRGSVIITGGASIVGFFYGDTWEWDGVAWTPVNSEQAPPLPALVSTAFHDPIEGRTMVFIDGILDPWWLRWESDVPGEACATGYDLDRDTLKGCADPDCWAICAPLCPPGAPCQGNAPRCGDGTCSSLETCAACPADCSCAAVCGDFRCEPDEDAATCPGDCAP